jgi:hypothetical protein
MSNMRVPWSPLRTLSAVFTAAKKSKGMPFNDKVCLAPYRRELICGQADIDIHDAMALRTGEMVMVLAPATDSIVMRPVSKLDAGEQFRVHQVFHRTIDRRPAYTRLNPSQLLPEIVNGKILAAAGQRYQPLRNEFAWTSVAPAHLVESRVNFICDHSSISFAK